MSESNALRLLREELGCTQEELATMLGVTKATISRYESESGPAPQGENAKKIAQLKSLVENDKAEVLEAYKKGGAPALSGLLAIGAAYGLGAGATVAAIAGLPAVGVIGGIASAMVGFKKFLGDNK